jgi:hypothetical protein
LEKQHREALSPVAMSPTYLQLSPTLRLGDYGISDHFSPEGLSVAEKTIEKFLSRAARLYEQEPGEAFAPSRLNKPSIVTYSVDPSTFRV